MVTALCRSCGAPVYWLHHARTGNLAPIDIEEGFGGNITIDLQAEEYTIVPKGSAPSGNRHRNHFASCPSASKHHKTPPAPTPAPQPQPAPATPLEAPQPDSVALDKAEPIR